MVEYDLHIHSTSSDGLLSPKEIFNIAKRKNLKGIAVTDHDTVDALTACKDLSMKHNIEFIPGIELSADYMGLEIHVLGYYIDYTSINLLRYLDILQKSRYERAEKMVKVLQNLNFKITFDEVLKNAGGNIFSIGRPHIARTLMDNGYFNNMSEVFESLIGAGKTAYVERYKISVEESVQLIINAGGIPVIAHPMLIKGIKIDNRSAHFIDKLITYGIKGIEAYHTKHCSSDEVFLKNIAMKNCLAVTGGSDCHGVLNNDDYLLGSKGIDSSEYKTLKKMQN